MLFLLFVFVFVRFWENPKIERLRQLASSLLKARQQELTLGLKHFRVILKEVDGWAGINVAPTNDAEPSGRAEQHEPVERDEEPAQECRHRTVDDRIVRLEQQVNALLRAFQHLQHAVTTRAISENLPVQLAVQLSHTAEQIRLCGQGSPLLEGLHMSYRVLKRQLELVTAESKLTVPLHCRVRDSTLNCHDAGERSTDLSANKRSRQESVEDTEDEQARNSRQPEEEGVES